jgi:hypothetical protein
MEPHSNDNTNDEYACEHLRVLMTREGSLRYRFRDYLGLKTATSTQCGSSASSVTSTSCSTDASSVSSSSTSGCGGGLPADVCRTNRCNPFRFEWSDDLTPCSVVSDPYCHHLYRTPTHHYPFGSPPWQMTPRGRWQIGQWFYQGMYGEAVLFSCAPPKEKFHLL